MQETWVRSLGWEDPLEEGMATLSTILAWRIPMDGGAWWAAVHGVAKSQTRLSNFNFTFHDLDENFLVWHVSDPLCHQPWFLPWSFHASLFVPRTTLKKKKKYLFIWLGLSCSMWDLSSLTRDWARVPCTGRWIGKHWATREVPLESFFISPRCSAAKLCLIICDPMDLSMPVFSIFHYLPEFAQTHAHWIGDAIQPFHPQPPTSPCSQSFPASGSFPVSRLFASHGQSIRASVSAPVLLMNIQDWFPLGLTGLIFFLSKELSRVFSNTTVRKHQFFGTQPSVWSNCHICTWLLEKP